MQIATTAIVATSTSTLVAFYNFHNAEKQITKFTNRATAERRCLALAAMIEEVAAMSEEEVQESHRSVRSIAVAKTWQDAIVAIKRLARDAVEVIVDGVMEVFSSVRAAFDALALPLVKHIRFRVALKNAGENVFVHNGKQYHFALYAE